MDLVFISVYLELCQVWREFENSEALIQIANRIASSSKASVTCRDNNHYYRCRNPDCETHEKKRTELYE
ncbi:hypothetical protein CEXT_92931 [Caerostris extrusa]|uniref:Uncharacterized protein n=1 Tax=Caerostris extrusa TaxID=172846 RepID=A0AAV4NUF5_CAEEX|nr:hypothetical protein CEXT_92931 [Caerostris extrusa]